MVRLPLEHAYLFLFRRYRVERFIYRHHRLIGVGVVTGALYILISLTPLFLATFSATPACGQSAFSCLFFLGLTRLLLAGGIVTFVLGGFIIIRPSALRAFEVWANRRILIRRRDTSRMVQSL